MFAFCLLPLMTKRIGIGQTLTLSRFCWYLQLYNPQANSLFCMAAICLKFLFYLFLIERSLKRASLCWLVCLFPDIFGIAIKLPSFYLLLAPKVLGFALMTIIIFAPLPLVRGICWVFVRWWISSFNLICTLRRIWILVSPTYLKDYIRYLYQYVLLVALSLCTLDHV